MAPPYGSKVLRRAQLGAYMWRKGLNSVKTASKWAHFTFLCTPNGLGSLLEKHVSDPFFTQFCSQSGPFSRHLGIFHGPKHVSTNSKWAKNTCLSIPNGVQSILEKHVFDPFLTHFWSQNGPCSRHLRIFQGPKRVTTGSKWAKITCLSIPSGAGALLEKRVFDPFLNHYWSQTGPFSRHFGIFMGQNASPRAQNGLKTLVSASQVVYEQLWKKYFFRPGDPGGPTVHPHHARAEVPCGSTR